MAPPPTPQGGWGTSVVMDEGVCHDPQFLIQLLHFLSSGAAELGSSVRVGSDRREEVVPRLSCVRDGLLRVFEIILCGNEEREETSRGSAIEYTIKDVAQGQSECVGHGEVPPGKRVRGTQLVALLSNRSSGSSCLRKPL